MPARPPPSSLPCSTPASAGPSGNASPAPGAPPADAAQAVNSHDLLRGHKTVTIAHNGSMYRLQATRLGKLILTK